VCVLLCWCADCCLLLHLLYPRRLQFDTYEPVTAPWTLYLNLFAKPNLRDESRVSDHQDGHKMLARFAIPGSLPTRSVAKDGHRRRQWGEESCWKTARPSAKPQRVTVRRPKILGRSQWHPPGQRTGVCVGFAQDLRTGRRGRWLSIEGERQAGPRTCRPHPCFWGNE
jgi:hypothetical protein